MQSELQVSPNTFSRSNATDSTRVKSIATYLKGMQIIVESATSYVVLEFLLPIATGRTHNLAISNHQSRHLVLFVYPVCKCCIILLHALSSEVLLPIDLT